MPLPPAKNQDPDAPTPLRRPFVELDRRRAESLFSHNETYALMKYATQDGAHVEWIWNSRPGVTPFIIDAHPAYEDALRKRPRQSTSLGNDDEADEDGEGASVIMRHVDWHLDRCLPFYKPAPGERVFIDYTMTEARKVYLRIVDRDWLTHEEAEATERELDEILAKNAPFFERVEADMAAWLETVSRPFDGKVKEPLYDADGEALIARVGKLKTRLHLRDNYENKVVAIETLARESIQQPGQPTVVLGSQYNAFNAMALAEEQALRAIERYRTEPAENHPDILAKYDRAREWFAEEVAKVGNMLRGESRTGGMPVIRAKE